MQRQSPWNIDNIFAAKAADPLLFADSAVAIT